MEDLRQSLDEFFQTQEDWIHRDQLKDLYNALTIEGNKKTQQQKAFNTDGRYSALAADPYQGYGDEQTFRAAEEVGGRGWQVCNLSS